LSFRCCCNAGRCGFAAGLEYGADLVKEMAAMQVRITLSGKERLVVARGA
jgi:hypothetical protein